MDTTRFDWLELERQGPRLRRLSLLRCHVAGTGYVPEIAERVACLRPGQDLLLQAEPENPYDARAVLVQNLRGEKLGYIPRQYNSEPAALLQQGETVKAALLKIYNPNDDWPQLEISVWRPLLLPPVLQRDKRFKIVLRQTRQRT